MKNVAANVSDDLHRSLRVLAAASGGTLRKEVLKALEAHVAAPHNAQLLNSVRGEPSGDAEHSHPQS